MSDSQTRTLSPSTSDNSGDVHWDRALRIPSIGAFPYYSSRFEAAVAARLAGSRPKLPRKMKKRVKRAEDQVRALRDQICKKLSSLPQFVNSIANREIIKNTLQSTLESTPGTSDIEVKESADGSYSFSYSFRTVTPVATKVFTIKKPDGMSDDEFQKFAQDLSNEINNSCTQDEEHTDD